MPRVRWVVSYAFYSKFHAVSSVAKILKIGKDLTKLQTVKWRKLVLRHNVE